MKKTKRRWWTRRQIRILREGARHGVGAPRIAQRTRRSEGAVRQKACELGVSLAS